MSSSPSTSTVRAVVVVRGGVASAFTDGHQVDLRIVDIDNIIAGDPPADFSQDDQAWAPLLKTAGLADDEQERFVVLPGETPPPNVTLEGILADLENMGIGDDDCDVNGGDAVEYLAALRNDLLQQFGASPPPTI